MSINFLSQEIIKTFYSVSPALLTSVKLPHEEWVSNLPEELKKGWSKSAALNKYFNPHKASEIPRYDSARIDKYTIFKNHDRALSLLRECYSLKERYEALDLELIGERAAIRLQNSDRKLDTLRINMIDLKARSFGQSTDMIGDISESNVELRTKPSGDGKNVELELFLATSEMTRKEEDIIRTEKSIPGSPYRLNESRDRLKCRFGHKVAELVCFINALRDGTNKIFKLSADKPKIDDTVFQLAVKNYLSGVGLRPEEAFDAGINYDNMEILDDIWVYLWNMAEVLEAKRVKSEECIAVGSLKEYLDNSDEPDHGWGLFLHVDTTPQLNLQRFYGSLNDGDYYEYPNTRILGIYAEVIINDEEEIKATEVEDGNRKYYQSVKAHKSEIGKKMNLSFSFTNEGERRKTSFVTSGRFIEESSLANPYPPSVFFGTRSLYLHTTSEGTLEIRRTKSHVSDAAVEDIIVYFHIIKFWD